MYIHALRYTVALPVCEEGLLNSFFHGSYECHDTFPIIRCQWNFFHVKFADCNSNLVFDFTQGLDVNHVLLQEMGFPPHITKSVTSASNGSSSLWEEEIFMEEIGGRLLSNSGKRFHFHVSVPHWDLGHWSKGFFARIFVMHDVFSKTNVQKVGFLGSFSTAKEIFGTKGDTTFFTFDTWQEALQRTYSETVYLILLIKRKSILGLFHSPHCSQAYLHKTLFPLLNYFWDL